MTRRFVSLFLLAVLVAAQALPASAHGMVCRMARPAPSKECVRCDVNAETSAIPTISSGSCCRFDSPRESAALPGVVGQSQRAASNDEFGSAVYVKAAAIADADTRAAAPLHCLSIRSTDPPSTSTTRLQL